MKPILRAAKPYGGEVMDLFDPVEVEGMKVFDPRSNEWKVSDNPALILGYIVTQKQGALVGEGFWPGIARLADYADGKQESVP